MRNVRIITHLAAVVACILVTTGLAQSFMDNPSTSVNTSKSSSGGKITAMSADDFKNTVKTLAKQNEAKLAEQVQQLTPTSNLSSASNASKSSSSGSQSNGTPPASPATPTAPAGYSGFGTGTAPANTGSSSGNSFKVNY